MRSVTQPMTILIADDDPEDRMLIREAFEEAGTGSQLRFVENGEELMDYLYSRGKYRDGRDAPRPALVLIDLNMPRKDGREALREIKADPVLCRIPVVVLTTSSDEQDIARTYEDGVNSFITKPVTFEKFVDVVRSLQTYWTQTVAIPPATWERN